MSVQTITQEQLQSMPNKITPQAGFQMDFLSANADIVIGGSGAGVGKSYALLLEPLYHINNPKFGCVIFRRESTQIRATGGLWEKSKEIYTHHGAEPNETSLTWKFPSGATIKFAHLQYEKDVSAWDGSEINLLCFDELQHFTQKQFIYMLSRNRSTSGIKPYVRATCNPLPDSWLAKFVGWWIDSEGFPIKSHFSKTRYFIRFDNRFIWGNTKDEVINEASFLFANMPIEQARQMIKSMQFIGGNIQENQKLLSVDGGYLANLMSLDATEKRRLLEGNWKISQDDLALCEFEKVNDIFSNILAPSPKKYIVCDHARFGEDFCTIKVYEGMKVVKMHVLTTSDTNVILSYINTERKAYNIGVSSIIIDQDGTGVVDALKCKTFLGGSSPIEVTRGAKPNYPNLKTQCAYMLCEEYVNKNLISIDLDNIYVNGEKASEVMKGGELHSIEAMIKQDLRAIKRKQGIDGKRMIISKEEQKQILGRSPDFADNLSMRMYFELNKQTGGSFGYS